MVRVSLLVLLLLALACEAEEGERGRRHASDGDATVADTAPGPEAASPDGGAPGDLAGEEPGPDGRQPETTSEGSESAPELPEPTPEVASPEPHPEAPEPTPETVSPEPHPEVVTPDTTAGASVYDLQTSAASLGCDPQASVAIGPIRLEGLVLTTPRFLASSSGGLDGYYAADSPASGPHRGLLVVVPVALATSFGVGDVVTIEGEHKEYYCQTEVLAANVVKTGTLPAPTPVAVEGWQVAASDPDSEPYEGVLVRVQGGTVTAVDAYGEIVIDDTWRIANEFELPYLADGGGKAVGDWIVSVTGVVEYSWGKYLVNPRFEEDLEVSKP